MYTGNNYRYGFNDKEKDDEVEGDDNNSDFGDRSIYDSRVNLFVSMDPRTGEFPYMSPYCFAANSPIRFIDNNGGGAGDIVGGFVIGIFTSVTPFPLSYAIRNAGGQFASNKDDYNHSLQSTDISLMLLGKNLIKGGEQPWLWEEQQLLLEVGCQLQEQEQLVEVRLQLEELH